MRGAGSTKSDWDERPLWYVHPRRVGVQTRSLGAFRLGATEPRKHFGENAVDGYVDLLARGQVLHADRARLDVTVTGDQSDRGA